MSTKLNVLLAKTDSLSSEFKNGLKDVSKFFKMNQGAFKGIQATYSPKEDTVDEPSKRGVKKVVTTVDEKLKYFVETHKEFISSLFSQEATNATGIAKANLIVEEEDWGEFTSLELLRLKSLIENGDFKQLYQNIPVRPDDIQWTSSQNEMYRGRGGIFESPLNSYENKTTEKESYILKDPNITGNGGANYVPQVAIKNITRVLGEGSTQHFSGEWSHRQRAEVLRRISILHTSVIEALKRANDCETVKSSLTAEKLFNYLHK